MEKYKKDRPCAKCGEIGATTKYINAVNYPWGIMNRGTMERCCSNCGFKWEELPLYAQKNNNSIEDKNEKSNNA